MAKAKRKEIIKGYTIDTVHKIEIKQNDKQKTVLRRSSTVFPRTEARNKCPLCIFKMGHSITQGQCHHQHF